ncbi:MAG: DUF1285 domain-containing protein [Pseudomonadota bacterium]
MSELETILESIRQGEDVSRIRQNWNPDRVGEIDIRIASDGQWYHQGRPFQRAALVKLFAGVLRRETSGYYLVTPAEKLSIQVDDAPFVANLVETVKTPGPDAIVFTTNIDERIILDPDHPLRIETDSISGEPRPYVYWRDGLEALISRSAFYDLINMAREVKRDNRVDFVVSSLGTDFELGSSPENE